MTDDLIARFKRYADARCVFSDDFKEAADALEAKDALIADWEFRHGNLSRHIDVLIDLIERQAARIAELEAQVAELEAEKQAFKDGNKYD